MPEPPSWAPFLSLGWSRPQRIEGGRCVEGTSIMMMMTTVQGVTLGTPPPHCWGPLHSMQSRAVLVCWGSHKTTPWPGQLKQHKGIFSQSWKLEIQDQGVMGLVSCEATHLGLGLDGHLHVAVPLCITVS